MSGNNPRDARQSTVRDPFAETRKDSLSSHVSSTLPGESDSKGFVALVALLALALLATALYFGPHWTVWRMRAAIDNRDAQALSSYVDFPSFRDSLKAQLLLMYEHTVGSTDDKANSFAALGKVLAAGITNSMVDAVVTPAGVLAMMEEGRVKPPSRPTVPAMPGASQLPPSTEPAPRQPSGEAPRYKIEYADFSTVRLKAVDGSPGAFVLRRRNLVQWKLAAVELSMP